ncbi:Uncharacterised protein [Klebsiella pneumoniae subsp. ozaenae]|uniref:Uncharacterized protein n=1 Tax=Klebsiella pneumoniae subsp. ozaenae TaxID=574 RepID=A0A377YX94_KLEPO|nr:Uncharacterised protein [Klebsiella pneumoniae subsp. ozaenae]
MRPLAESGIELRGEVPLLRRALALQLRESGVHLVNLLIELVQAILGFAQFAGRGGDRLFLRFELASRLARCCCCCLIARCLAAMSAWMDFS